jgi:hypothetical protein
MENLTIFLERLKKPSLVVLLRWDILMKTRIAACVAQWLKRRCKDLVIIASPVRIPL